MEGEEQSQENATGYGPRRAKSTGGKWERLVFNGDENKYELWEVKFLGHLRMLGLKDTILSKEDNVDREKNEECYAELIQFLDDKSLSLVMHDATDDGRKALQILQDHYASQGKPRIIALYTELTSLKKTDNETVTDYIIRAEKAVTSLRNAKEVISDGLIIAMILKGLPESYKPFAIHTAQSTEEITFTQFKSNLRSYEETEKFDNKTKADNVMKVDISTVTCYGCGNRGHVARDCRQRGASKWCSYHKSSTHSDETCRRREKFKDEVKQTAERQDRGNWCSYHRSSTHNDETCRNRDQQKDDAKQSAERQKPDKEERSFVFTVSHTTFPEKIKKLGLMVDCGATSHILTDMNCFTRFEEGFNPSSHYMELADGTRMNNVALRRGDAEVLLQDVRGRSVTVTLKKALYIPTYPQSIISVQATTADGAKVIFKEGQSELINRDGRVFNIEVHGRLYYLKTVNHLKHNVSASVNDMMSSDKANLTCDVKTWHEIMGHCNVDDVLKLPGVVDGMKITGNAKLDCNVCTEGKFTNTRNRKLDSKATKILELVHTDLAGPIEPISHEGYKYAVSFTDDYSGAVSVYFLKNKSDTTVATEKFLADTAPYGTVKCIRSDNGTEYTGNEFQSLMRERGIRHETSSPYSPHQNGTAERQWRTIFEMGRCLLLEKGLPKTLWPYAVQTAAHIRNRCFNDRTQNTPYFLLTGKKPDLSKMWVFGSDCYAYRHDHSKLDSRSDKGIFVGYSRNSPAYLVYHPQTRKVSKHRLVKFITKSSVEQETQTDDDDYEIPRYTEKICDIKNKNEKSQSEGQVIDANNEVTNTGDKDKSKENDHTETKMNENDENTAGTSTETYQERHYSERERRAPKYLEDYVTCSKDKMTNVGVDSCYRAVFGLPQTYREAIMSPEASRWEQAMKEEMSSLKENDTFELVTLPKDKNTVGGRWVYALKENADTGKIFKARYVAKGYKQTEGIDYHETFAPTANLTSVRALMQIAVQNDFSVHQMDVKTAYLHAPIDEEIYLDQPEGFEELSKTGGKLVCKLRKSLYGLKQSGRNWYKLLNDHLEQNNFERNQVDHCVYRKQIESDTIIVIIWVDDLIIAASSVDQLNKFKETMKSQFNMKDLGQISNFLGIQFEQKEGEIKMSQEKYIAKMLERFGMSDCKPRATPNELKMECNKNVEENNTELENPKDYREIVGSLIYAMTCTRPDISWVVSKLSQSLAKPTVQDLVAAKHVLRYLKGTSHYELCFKKSDEALSLTAFSDSDWASSVEDRRSTTGYCFSLTKQGPAISWKSKKQPTVALSTCEAEYIGLANTTQESLYLMQLMNDLDSNVYNCTTIYGDNQGAIALSKNPVHRSRCKHIDVKYHFIRDVLKAGRINIKYCPTETMVADILTKSVTKVRILQFKSVLFGN